MTKRGNVMGRVKSELMGDIEKLEYDIENTGVDINEKTSAECAWAKYTAELAIEEPNRVWSKEEKDKFIATYNANLDLFFGKDY